MPEAACPPLPLPNRACLASLPASACRGSDAYGRRPGRGGGWLQEGQEQEAPAQRRGRRRRRLPARRLCIHRSRGRRRRRRCRRRRRRHRCAGLSAALPAVLLAFQAGRWHDAQAAATHCLVVRHASVSNVLCLPTCPAPRCPAESVGAAVPRQKAASRQYIEDMYLQRKRRRERYK